MNIPLDQLSKILSEKIGDSVHVTEIKSMPGGYEAESFMILTDTDKKFFLKRVKNTPYNKIRAEQNTHWFLVSDAMMMRSPASSDGLGVLIQNKNKLVPLSSINEKTEVFHIQKFEKLSEKNYWETLQLKKDKDSVSKDNLKEVRDIAELLFAIHNAKTDFGDSETKNRIYNDSLASVFTAQDLYFFFLHTFNKKHPFFPPSEHTKHTAEMLNLFHEFKDNGKRLRPLHGDFWGTNIYKKKDGSWYAVDYSRIPFGDPGVDVSCFLAQFLWLYHQTKNNLYKELGEEFLNHYEKISGDKEIKKFSTFPLGLWGLVWITPYFYPDRTGADAKSFLNKVQKIMRKREFVWE